MLHPGEDCFQCTRFGHWLKREVCGGAHRPSPAGFCCQYSGRRAVDTAEPDHYYDASADHDHPAGEHDGAEDHDHAAGEHDGAEDHDHAAGEHEIGRAHV